MLRHETPAITHCCAKTTMSNGSIQSCGQQTAISCDTESGDTPLCEYHQKVADQTIEPCTDPECTNDLWGEPTKVTAHGVTIWSSLYSEIVSQAVA